MCVQMLVPMTIVVLMSLKLMDPLGPIITIITPITFISADLDVINKTFAQTRSPTWLGEVLHLLEATLPDATIAIIRFPILIKMTFGGTTTEDETRLTLTLPLSISWMTRRLCLAPTLATLMTLDAQMMMCGRLFTRYWHMVKWEMMLWRWSLLAASRDGEQPKMRFLEEECGERITCRLIIPVAVAAWLDLLRAGYVGLSVRMPGRAAFVHYPPRSLRDAPPASLSRGRIAEGAHVRCASYVPERAAVASRGRSPERPLMLLAKSFQVFTVPVGAFSPSLLLGGA